MIARMTLLGIVLSAAAGVGAYRWAASQDSTTTASGPAADAATEALAAWLGLTSEQRAQVARDDPRFAADLSQLRVELQARRDALATKLEAAQASDAEIESVVEARIAAQNALERRVTKYLLAVRPHLSAEQQRKLFGLCAEEVRQAGGRRWRGGAGGEAAGPGRGPGPHGPGRGRGNGWRGGAGR